MNKKTTVIVFILMLVALAFTIVPAGAATTTLVGKMNYFTYAIISQEVLQDLDCPAAVDLAFLEDKNFELVLTENGACGGRTTVLQGKITPSGQLKLGFPDPLFYLPDGTPVTIEDLVKGHTGCTILAGDFPVFYGSFDGQSFVADTAFTCLIPEYWPSNDLFDTPVDGPLQFVWSLDLTVSP